MPSSVVGNPFGQDLLASEYSDTVFEWAVPVADSWIPEFDPSDPITFSPDMLWYLLIVGFVGLVLLGFFALILLLLS